MTEMWPHFPLNCQQQPHRMNWKNLDWTIPSWMFLYARVEGINGPCLTGQGLEFDSKCCSYGNVEFETDIFYSILNKQYCCVQFILRVDFIEGYKPSLYLTFEHSPVINLNGLLHLIKPSRFILYKVKESCSFVTLQWFISNLILYNSALWKEFRFESSLNWENKILHRSI